MFGSKKRIKARLQEEQTFIRQRLKYTLNLFQRERTEENFEACISELSCAVLYNLPLYVPVRADSGRYEYDVFPGMDASGRRFCAFQAGISEDPAANFPLQRCTVIKARDLFTRAVGDARFGSIIFDPAAAGSSLRFGREALSAILRNVEQTILSQPRDLRAALLSL